MKRFLALFLFIAPVVNAQVPMGGVTVAGAGGGSAPTMVTGVSHQCKGNSGTSPVSCSATMTPTAGDDLYTWVWANNGTATFACSDGTNGSYTAGPGGVYNDGDGNAIEWFRAASVAGTAVTPSCTASAGSTFQVQTVEATHSTGGIDSSATGTTAHSTSSPLTVSLSTSSAPELGLAVVESNVAPSYSTWTSFTTNNFYQYFNVGYLSLSSSGSNSFQATATTPSFMTAYVIPIKP